MASGGCCGLRRRSRATPFSKKLKGRPCAARRSLAEGSRCRSSVGRVRVSTQIGNPCEVSRSSLWIIAMSAREKSLGPPQSSSFMRRTCRKAVTKFAAVAKNGRRASYQLAQRHNAWRVSSIFWSLGFTGTARSLEPHPWLDELLQEHLTGRDQSERLERVIRTIEKNQQVSAPLICCFRSV